MEAYIKNILISIDQFVNCICFGTPDETISARCWRNRNNSYYWKFWQLFIDKILWFDKDHCLNSYLSEVNRKQYPKAYHGINK